MRDIVPRALMLYLFGLLSLNAQPQPIIHHNLTVDLAPFQHTLAVSDTIELPPRSNTQPRNLYFRLNAGLELSSDDTGTKFQVLELTPGQGIKYRVSLPPAQNALKLTYEGHIVAPLDTSSLIESISAQGVFLSLRDLWYPHFDAHLSSFTLQVNLPPGWTAISQGNRVENAVRSHGVAVTWSETNPQEDIYLVAGPYHEYRGTTSIAQSLVFLHDDDPDLAETYLKATALYLEMYQQLLGAYPYAKFAAVENTQETGYGMPSFTLLGPRVIRLPFIVHTSYPHEILHNWWGNGVYVDHEQGNWSEGLTAYLADHLIQEQQGRGAQYRRGALQKYANYVNAGLDFPLKDFHARHDEASQAIGYNKALMFFHMLRLRLGDEAFIQGLRTFYRQNRFKRAGFPALRKAFEEAGGTDLAPMFAQWIERRGAPSLSLSDAQVHTHETDYILTARLHQGDQIPPYRLDIPIAITLEGRNEIFEQTVSMQARSQAIRFQLSSKPLDIQLDPRFDLFRRLDPLELPASLGQFFGASQKVLVLPSDAPPSLRESYRELAENWSQRDSGIEIHWDDRINKLPKERAVLLLGWENRFLDSFLHTLVDQDVKRQNNHLRLAGKNLEQDSHSLVLTGRDQADARQSLAWLGTTRPQALKGLARKLPHYSKYSYLAFVGDEPSIAFKGQWPVPNSPLRKQLAGAHHDSPSPKLTPREPLTHLIPTER